MKRGKLTGKLIIATIQTYISMITDHDAMDRLRDRIVPRATDESRLRMTFPTDRRKRKRVVFVALVHTKHLQSSVQVCSYLPRHGD
jgi:hypothetical protein